MAQVTIDLDEVQIRVMLRSEEGMVGKNMTRRGKRVLSEAKRRIHSKTGRLQRSGYVRASREQGEAGVEVGFSARHAKFVHDGTGIYGPTGLPIRPRTRSVLKFRVGGVTIFAPSVRGQEGSHYLRDALVAALE